LGVAEDGDETALGPLRRCIVTGAVRPKAELLRFVVAPDGSVVPDIAERLPGRGLWLTPRRDIVATAVGKRLFARAARAPVKAPDDLADRVERLLILRCRDLVGLARRAGRAVAGFEKVREALRGGAAGVLVAAADGGESGRDKLRRLGIALPLVEALGAAELGQAFGRDHVVHAAVAPGRLARELEIAAARLAAFRAAPGADGSEMGTGQRRQQGRRRRNEVNSTGTR
jgi:predicted RNA-binding protein YlxR (DUF448 family)